MSEFARRYLSETIVILERLDREQLDRIVESLRGLQGRLFTLGVGGSAATASHAASDFRKMAGIEAYSVTDNVVELTARTNDDGWEHSFSDWLHVSRLSPLDAILVVSVGGGRRDASPNITAAVRYARGVGATVLGVVGRDGGYTAKHANACLVIPPVIEARVTPHTEGIASVVMHLLMTALTEQH